MQRKLSFRFALDVNATDGSGASPLMLAALAGNVVVIKKLVEKGADVNLQDSANGWTALMQVRGISILFRSLLIAALNILDV